MEHIAPMANGKPWLPEHTLTLRQMAADGYNDSQIAEVTGRVRKTICRHRRRLGVEAGSRRGRTPWTPERLAASLRARFDSSYIPEPNSGCLLWTGRCDDDGYGVIGSSGIGDVSAHRVAYEYANGPIPAGLHVCHKCDVPSCVNPDHLFVGTAGDNMRDKERKGRGLQPKGEAHGRSKLTERDVIEIRQSSQQNRLLAERYGVSASVIGGIKRLEGWTHVP